MRNKKRTSLKNKNTAAHKKQSTTSSTKVSNVEQKKIWQKWLLNFEKAQRPSAPEAIPGQHSLLYLLTEIKRGHFTIEINQALLSHDGHWSQLKPYSADLYSFSYHLNDLMSPLDTQILKMLTSAPRTGKIYTLEGFLGGHILELVISTNRIYLKSFDIPLQSRASRLLEWQWLERKNQQQVTPSVAGLQKWTIICVDPPYYINFADQGIGKLESTLTAAQISQLLQAPEIPVEQFSEFSVQLRMLVPVDQLPLPQEEQLTIQTTFTPRLRIVSTVTVKGVRIPGVLLSFDYNGCIFDFEPGKRVPTRPELYAQQGQNYWVQRDKDMEELALVQLTKMGLEITHSIGDFNTLWVVKHPNNAEMLRLWQVFMEKTIHELEKQGWVVIIDPDYVLPRQATDFKLVLRDGKNHWFDFSLQLPIIAGHSLNTQQVIAYWMEQGEPNELSISLEGNWLDINTQPLQAIRSLIHELYAKEKLNRYVSMPPYQAAQLGNKFEYNEREAPLTARLIKQFNNFAGLQTIPVSAQVHATLRSYQQHGLNWLGFLQEYGLGGILADDMGLGKTLQTLCLIQWMKDTQRLNNGPVIVVAPTSLMGNWIREANHFTPQLTTCLIHGSQRAEQFNYISASDLVVTSYPLLIRDAHLYKPHHFALVVLDEAQAIKNPLTKVSQQVRSLQANSRICLTGTPLENHLGELWSLMDFAMPGLLEGKKAFKQHYRQPIEQEGDEASQKRLAQRVAPFMLRRTKTEVVTELPPKTEILQYVELEGQQRDLYEAIRVSMETHIRDLVESQGMARSHIAFLDALLKLRQACIDPSLVKLEAAADIKQSAKLDWLNETLPEMLEEKRRILIFSQFTTVLSVIEKLLKRHKVEYSKLTGQTRHRQVEIDRFQSGEVAVFLISLKAGGSGLNLTSADTVIHVDPWWNPAVEQQATDRAYRLGQDKPVFVYKLVAADTVEERIQQMQKEKQALADALFDETGKAGMPKDKDALLALLS